MDEIKQRLESELSHTMNRIRQMGGAVVLEEFPAAIGDNTPLADEVDVIRQNEDREMSFATRSLLVGRANKLAEALQRLRGWRVRPLRGVRRGHRPGPTSRPAGGDDVRALPGPDRAHVSRLELVGAGFDGEEPDED